MALLKDKFVYLNKICFQRIIAFIAFDIMWVLRTRARVCMCKYRF